VEVVMKKLILVAGILGVLAFLLAALSGAQQQVPPAAPKAARLYNPQAVETLTGKVAAVKRIAPKKAGKPERVTMVLQTDHGGVKVHLGPAAYLDQQALKLAAGDQVAVKGVKVSRPKVTIFIAGEVRKGDQVLKLRDEATGRPLWFKGKKGNGAA
jgi:hypothetical protein